MERFAERLSSIRCQICPRTAYATGGTAAKRLTIVKATNDCEDYDVIVTDLKNNIVKKGEFDEFYEISMECNDMKCGIPTDHVTLITKEQDDGKFSYDSLVEFAQMCIKSRYVPLIMVLVLESLIPHTEEELKAITKANRRATEGVGVSYSDLAMNKYRLVSFYNISRVATTTDNLSTFNGTKTKDTLGSHGQPAVFTRNQFRYLWEQHAKREALILAKIPGSSVAKQQQQQASAARIDSGKRRVLQRLADRDCVNTAGGGFMKLSIEKWNEKIQSCLDHDKDDFGIYNEIRKITLGRTLEQDIAIRLSEDACSSDADNSGNDSDADDDIFGKKAIINAEKVANIAETEAEAGRAGFMVKMTLECVPDNQKSRISSYLDYGCAEGAITATMGSTLQLPASRVYGADVRAIPAEGFTFIQLPAEDDNKPPDIGEILPNIKEGSISLVTSAMVLHHVKHPLAILQELRRVLKPNGCIVLREHHCDNPEMATFLDITHGLYSLAWSKPVEWPNFLDEYEAWYRPQTEWDNLACAAGFTRVIDIPKITRHYEVKSSMKNDGRIGNLIKAYYCTYLPTIGHLLPKKNVLPTTQIKSNDVNIVASLYGGGGSGSAETTGSLYGGSAIVEPSNREPIDIQSKKRSFEDTDTNPKDIEDISSYKKRTQNKEEVSLCADCPEISREEPVTIYESRSNRGHYYYQNSGGSVVWAPLLHIKDASPVISSDHPVQPYDLAFLYNDKLRKVKKIIYQ